MTPLLSEILRLPSAERFDLAFKISESIGYVLTKDSERKRHKRLENHDVLVARGEAEPL